jgi:hypothetical protein
MRIRVALACGCAAPGTRHTFAGSNLFLEKRKPMRRITLAVPGAYVWTAMVAFGGIAVETIVIYPNVFHDPPASLAGAVDFFTVTGRTSSRRWGRPPWSRPWPAR